MFTQRRVFKFATLLIALLLTLQAAAFAQDKAKKKKKEPRTGTPVLWKDPGDISARDLYLGPGGVFSRSRNDPADYVKSKFIQGVESGRVKFAYSGKNSALFKDITVEDARWVGSLLSQLTDQQLTDAFRAANFTPEEIETLVGAARQRINQLVSLPGGGAVAGTN